MANYEIIVQGTWHMKRLGAFNHDGGTVTLGVIHAFDRHNRMPIIDAYRAVQDYNDTHHPKVRMVRAKVADEVLSDQDRENWLEFMNNFRFAVDGALAYEMPGKQFGEFITARHEATGRRLILPTGKYKGERNICLRIRELRYSDFQDTERKDVHLNLPDSRFTPVTDFPIMNGWYRLHRRQDLPSAEEGDLGNGRNFTRKKGAHVAPIIRDAVFNRFSILADGSFFDKVWAIVEVVEKSMPAGVRQTARVMEPDF
jgi:hypothetical protein